MHSEVGLLRNLPCQPRGRRSLPMLLRYWNIACCGPIRWRSASPISGGGNTVVPLLSMERGERLERASNAGAMRSP